jgi:hypothetical protein
MGGSENLQLLTLHPNGDSVTVIRCFLAVIVRR